MLQFSHFELPSSLCVTLSGYHIINSKHSLPAQVDIGRGTKPPGYYVQRSCGMFPAPYPQDDPKLDQVEKLFQFMGMFFAKCIQDSRLVDIPLARPFLKLMCLGDVVDNVSQSYRELLCRHDSMLEAPICTLDEDITPTEEGHRELILDARKLRQQSSCSSMLSTSGVLEAPWYGGLLNHEDFQLIDPHRAHFLSQLQDLVARKQEIQNNLRLSEDEKERQLDCLTLRNPPVKLEDLRSAMALS